MKAHERRCENCSHWKPGPTHGLAGECRKLPPVVIVFGDGVETHFPEANVDDWCGGWAWRQVA